MGNHYKVTLEDLGFSYNGKTLLRDINLALSEQALIAITGPSGSGKSTFLSLFNRLWEEDQGSLHGRIQIAFNNTLTDIYNGSIPIHILRRRVGMVFQNPNLLPVNILKM